MTTGSNCSSGEVLANLLETEVSFGIGEPSMKLLRVCVLSLFVFASATFAQRGGGHGGGGGIRGGGGSGFRGGGGGGGYRGGGGFTSGGGYRGGSGFRGGIGVGLSRGGYGRGFGGYRYGYGRGFGYRGYSIFGFGYGYGYPFYAGYGGYYDYYPYSYYPYSYDPYSYSYAPVTYAAPSSVYYDPAPAVAAPVRPVQTREYKEPIYLIAFSDHRIQACLAYWVEGDTLHYVTREHEHKQVSLDGIDRAFSEQLNRDRRVEFRLPR